MKTPNDSRPRFQSANRHYHRYREENQDGWSEWITPSKKSGGRRKMRLGWVIVALVVIGLIGLVATMYLKVV